MFKINLFLVLSYLEPLLLQTNTKLRKLIKGIFKFLQNKNCIQKSKITSVKNVLQVCFISLSVDSTTNLITVNVLDAVM